MGKRILLLYVLCGFVMGFACLTPAAHAEMIGTDKIAAPAQADQDRARVQSLLERPAATQQLQALGVPPEQAQARVAALSDEEIHRIAGKLDALPAGGWDDFQVLVVVLLAVLIALIL
jgi:uncharacterized protein DUF6627